MFRLQSGLFSVLLLGLASSPATADEVWSLDGVDFDQTVQGRLREKKAV